MIETTPDGRPVLTIKLPHFVRSGAPDAPVRKLNKTGRLPRTRSISGIKEMPSVIMMPCRPVFQPEPQIPVLGREKGITVALAGESTDRLGEPLEPGWP